MWDLVILNEIRALIAVNRTKTRVYVVYTIAILEGFGFWYRALIAVNRTKTRVYVVYWSGDYVLLAEKT